MATVVLDLNLLELPTDLSNLHAYDSAFVLIRFGRRPVGQAWLPVRAGRIDGLTLHEELVRAGGWPLWQAWVETYLAPLQPPDPPLPSATIAICTRDRAADLARCLASLQLLPADGQEILVVDSAPSDDSTLRVVQQFPGVRYLREARRGLAKARNSALRAAQGEIVAFTDDDVTVDPGWLRALLHHFADPLVLGVTGLTMPFELETPAQEWFERFAPFGRGFQRRVFDMTNHNPLRPNAVGSGANLALRRAVLHLVGPFDEAFGPGTPSKSGVDTELITRILQAGYRLVYDPSALNWHRHRREWEAMVRRINDYGTGDGAFWTRELLVQREAGVVPLVLTWLARYSLPRYLDALRRQSPLATLIGANLRGFWRGPAAYLAARRRLRELDRP